jgi:G3E family GTPase
MPVPVTVVTGFLGAGKTTLVNRWLADAPRSDVAVVVNEQGDVGIDAAILAARVRALVEITGGCLCCSTQAVDATRLGTLATHDLAIEQVGYADLVVLSRADECELEWRERAKEVVAAHNGAALVVTAARGALEDPALPTLEALLQRRRDDFPPVKPVPAAPSRHVYESVSLLLDGAVDGERFADFVESELAPAGGRLFRTKGILAVHGVPERMILQGVTDQVEVTFGAPWEDQPRTSRLVVVGFGLDREALSRAFNACAAVES